MIATGGSGGHVFPAQAVCEEMIKHWSCKMLVDKRGEVYIKDFCIKIYMPHLLR